MKADPEDVVAFLEVAQRGSFSKAASALGVQKSSISRRIQKLELTLSTQLLTRTTRRLQLTEAGRSYFERAQRAFEELTGAEQILEGMLEQPKGVLKVTIPIGLEEPMGQIVERYLGQYSEVSVVTYVTNQHMDLVAEGFDIGIRGGALQDSSLIARKLAPADFGLWASPDYLACHGTPHTAEELVQHRCLVFGLSVETTCHLLGPKGSKHVSLQGVMACNTFGLLVRAAVNGGGIVCCPAAAVQRLLAESGQRPRLVRVLPEYSMPAPGLYVVYPSSAYLTPKVRHFIDLCLQESSLFLPTTSAV